ncbi:SNAP receptor [Mortierella sp. AD094]|nr:SNAP receptor [Mortierella sp. AD094]
MSFADLERGQGGIKRGNVPGPSPLGRNSVSSNGNGNGNWNQQGTDSLGDVSQHAYQAKITHISQQVFRISSNVSTIQRLVGYLGTLKDSQDVRTKLQDITEQSRILVRDTSQDIKDLTKFDAAGKKLEHQKVSKDFSKVLVEFQKVQRVSAEKQRDFVLKARQVGTRNDYYDDESGDTGEQPLINDDQRRMQLLVVDNELEYNESMITQREEEIREIEQGITELNEIFRDLGSMVHEQGNMLDSIESNVSSIAVTTHTAAEELTTAAVHQKNARNKSCYLLLIVAAVAAIVILAALN